MADTIMTIRRAIEFYGLCYALEEEDREIRSQVDAPGVYPTGIYPLFNRLPIFKKFVYYNYGRLADTVQLMRDYSPLWHDEVKAFVDSVDIERVETDAAYATQIETDFEAVIAGNQPLSETFNMIANYTVYAIDRNLVTNYEDIAYLDAEFPEMFN